MPQLVNSWQLARSGGVHAGGLQNLIAHHYPPATVAVICVERSCAETRVTSTLTGHGAMLGKGVRHRTNALGLCLAGHSCGFYPLRSGCLGFGRSGVCDQPFTSFLSPSHTVMVVRRRFCLSARLLGAPVSSEGSREGGRVLRWMGGPGGCRF